MSEEKTYRNPAPTVDIIVEWKDQGIVLIERKNPPYGWALPGGFVDYGESVEHAAIREALEETCLHVELVSLFGVYSDPRRDPRKHIMSTVFIARATSGEPRAADDAINLQVFSLDNLPRKMCFDHGHILKDYLQYRKTGKTPSFGAGHRGLYEE